MKLSDFENLNKLVLIRNGLKEKIDIVSNNGKYPNGLGVTIQGSYQDSYILDVVRPVVLDQLNERLRLVDEQIIALGVNVS
jgi:hypothetical protein